MIPKLPAGRAWRGIVFRLAVATFYLLASQHLSTSAVPIDNGLVDSEFIKGQWVPTMTWAIHPP